MIIWKRLIAWTARFYGIRFTIILRWILVGGLIELRQGMNDLLDERSFMGCMEIVFRLIPEC